MQKDIRVGAAKSKEITATYDRVIGSRGKDFDIEIGNEPWFPELLKTTGNFGLGLLPISSGAVVQGLTKVAAP